MKKTYFSLLITLVFIPAASFAASTASTVNLKNPIEGSPTIQVILGNLVTAALGVMGSLALIALIAGGFMWLTSAGSPDKVKKGLNTMAYAAIGLFVIFSSYAILNTVISGLKASPTPPVSNSAAGNSGAQGHASIPNSNQGCTRVAGWSCIDVNNCAVLTGTTKDEKLENCKTNGSCKTGLCLAPGSRQDQYTICCKS